MELWIRSQDRESLVKVDNLYVSVGNYICYYVEKGKEVPNTYYRPSGELGRYSTKERAIEVLDEIQNILQTKYILDSSSIRPDDSWVKNGIIMQNYNANVEIKELSTCVYQMPKIKRRIRMKAKEND